MKAASFPVGGNPPLPDILLQAGRSAGPENCVWLASGRDGYLLIARSLGDAEWFLPDFFCAVVPETLGRSGIHCTPYRPGKLRNAWKNGGRARVSVLVWDVADGPAASDASAVAEDGGLWVEDRCLWAGMPSQIPAPGENAFAVGSLRKWLGVAEGGWVRSVRALGTERLASAPARRTHVAAQLAASALRRLRLEMASASASPEAGRLEADQPEVTLLAANLLASTIAEETLGIPRDPRPISRLGMALAECAGEFETERLSRLQTAREIQKFLESKVTEQELSAGVLGLRLWCSQRDALLARLAELEIHAPVHWRDGDWSKAAGAAASLADQTLTLPCPALPDEAARSNYLERLRRALKPFEYRMISMNRDNG